MSNEIQPNIVLFRYTGINNADIHAQLCIDLNVILKQNRKSTTMHGSCLCKPMPNLFHIIYIMMKVDLYVS